MLVQSPQYLGRHPAGASAAKDRPFASPDFPLLAGGAVVGHTSATKGNDE